MYQKDSELATKDSEKGGLGIIKSNDSEPMKRVFSDLGCVSRHNLFQSFSLFEQAFGFGNTYDNLMKLEHYENHWELSNEFEIMKFHVMRIEIFDRQCTCSAGGR